MDPRQIQYSNYAFGNNLAIDCISHPLATPNIGIDTLESTDTCPPTLLDTMAADYVR